MSRQGVSLAEAARPLSISPKTLLDWVRRAKAGALPSASAGAPRHTVSDAEAELSRPRREVAELRTGRDILNKSAAYFASESLRGTR